MASRQLSLNVFEENFRFLLGLFQVRVLQCHLFILTAFLFDLISRHRTALKSVMPKINCKIFSKSALCTGPHNSCYGNAVIGVQLIVRYKVKEQLISFLRIIIALFFFFFFLGRSFQEICIYMENSLDKNRLTIIRHMFYYIYIYMYSTTIIVLVRSIDKGIRLEVRFSNQLLPENGIFFSQLIFGFLFLITIPIIAAPAVNIQ